MEEPELFTKINASNTAETKKVLDKYQNSIKWNGKDWLLDIGCGPGDVTMNVIKKRMPETCEKLVAVDISEKMIEYCKEKYKDERNVEFCLMDIGADMKDYPDFLEKFDHVMSFTVLQWVQDQRKVFSNILKLLKPGGDLLATFVASTTSFYMYEQIHEKWNLYMHDYKKFIGPYHHSDDPAAEVRKILHTVGFHEYKVEIKYQEQVVKSADDLKTYIIAVSPFASRIPDKKRRDQFLNEVVEYYTEMGCRQPDGRFVYPCKMIVVYAKK
uniref:CSON015553 protein n=1 Tax=Culicoides sonorensis TaxID=179676 RepID=A0A336MDP8_CULSO